MSHLHDHLELSQQELTQLQQHLIDTALPNLAQKYPVLPLR